MHPFISQDRCSADSELAHRVPCCSLRVDSMGNSELGRTPPCVWALTSSFWRWGSSQSDCSVRTEANWLPEVPLSPAWNPWYGFGSPGHHSPFIPAPRYGIPCVNSGVIKHASWESHFLFLWNFYNRTLPFIITAKLPFIIRQFLKKYLLEYLLLSSLVLWS